MAEPSKVKGAVGTRNPDTERTRKPYVKPEIRVSLTKEAKEARDKAKHDTDSKMTAEQLRTVKTFEEKHKNYKTERVAMVDEKGRIVAQSSSGSRNKTSLTTIPGVDYSSTVVTHNHPDEEGFGAKGIARSIGISFSGADLKAVAHHNAKGVRARANGYTFFLGRKGDKYPVDGRTLANEWTREFQKFQNGYIKSNGKRDMGATAYAEQKYNEAMSKLAAGDREGMNKAYEEYKMRWARMNATASHYASRAVAKKYDLIYTRKKN